VKASLNYIILVGPILILEDIPSVGIFYLCVACHWFGIWYDDSFVVSKKCVCVNYDLLGHFSHFMFSAGGVVHTCTCCVTLHLCTKLNNSWKCNNKIL